MLGGPTVSCFLFLKKKLMTDPDPLFSISPDLDLVKIGLDLKTLGYPISKSEDHFQKNHDVPAGPDPRS